MSKSRFHFGKRIIGALILNAFCWQAFAAPQVKPKTPRASISKVVNPLRGERLPIPVWSWEGEPRNEDWQDLARLLRVRDLRVHDWRSAYNIAGDAEKQKSEVLRQLKRAGYKVEEFEWKLREWQKTDGFEARRGSEILSAMWGNNGSHLFLYWGHQEPESPAQKRNDGLIAAVLEGDVAKVRELLKQGANPRAIDYSGVSVLTWASARSNAEIVAQLLEARKLQPKIGPDADFDAAFQTAVEREDTILLQKFLAGGATPNQIGSALRSAAASGTAKSAKMLIPGAPISDVDSALITASFVNEWRGSPIQYPEIVKLLLVRKPSQSALDTAMIRAAQDDEADIVLVLLQADADVKARDEKGRTALLISAADFRDTRNIQALLDAGADPNARDKKDVSVLINASLNFSNIIEFLLSHGANPKARNAKEITDGENLISLLQSRIGYKLDNSPKEKLSELVDSLKKALAG